ncbi:AMP-dependent synthetase and ligase domain protein [Candidatus Magnetomorum sp. HK-1]|nr:AMP-dependent synthetase and ligase domain protein [Candidatus Magnetomorum sp. HK-1]
MPHAHLTENTIIGLFNAQAQRYQDDIFMFAKFQNGKACKEWVGIAWNEAAQEIKSLSAGLIINGIKKNDCVAIFAQNRPRWIFSDLAIQGTGGISVPIYPTSTPDQVTYILNDCKAKAIITGDLELLSLIKNIEDKVPSLNFIVSMTPVDEFKDSTVLNYADIVMEGSISKNAQEKYSKNIKNLTLNDIASIIYTSGTTGDPKGVVIDYSNFKAQTDIILSTSMTQKIIERGIRLTSLCHLPLCHILGRTSDYHAQIAMGSTIYFAESIRKVQENLLEVRPQVLITVPRLYEKIYEAVLKISSNMTGYQKYIFDWTMDVGDKASDYLIKGESMPISLSLKFALSNIIVFEKIRQKAGLDRLVMAASGGGALSGQIAKFFRSMNIIVAEGYGLTETTSAATWNGPNLIESLPDKWIYQKSLDWLIDAMVIIQKSGKTPFKTLSGFFKILVASRLIIPKLIIKPGFVGRPCKGTDIKIANDGEILIRGPQVFKKHNGYYNLEDDTEKVFTQDGYFKTGDIGAFDSDGFLKITDRKKELLVTAGGKNIAPHPIELSFSYDPYIDQICVIGDSKKFISALVVPQFEILEKWAIKKNIEDLNRDKLITHPDVCKLYDYKISEINQNFPRYEQIKKYQLLPNNFSVETGELTPTLKMKRRVIYEKYKHIIDSFYL